MSGGNWMPIADPLHGVSRSMRRASPIAPYGDAEYHAVAGVPSTADHGPLSAPTLAVA